MSNYAAMSPVEIDTTLAEIYGRMYKVEDEIARKSGYAKDLREGIAKHLSGEFGGRYSSYKQSSLDTLLAEIEALREQHYAIRAEAVPFHDEYNRRPWTRFFLVANNGGHIHSSMGCSTCFATTRFGWLPEESGKDEATAVAKHGAILCTVCYPTAPTEWTNGKKPGDEDVCEGSGRYFDRNLPHRTGYYSGNWAECPECHTNQTVTKAFKIRKHKR